MIKKRNGGHPHNIHKFMAYGKAMKRMYMKLKTVTDLLKQVMMISGKKMKEDDFWEDEDQARCNTS